MIHHYACLIKIVCGLHSTDWTIVRGGNGIKREYTLHMWHEWNDEKTLTADGLTEDGKTWTSRQQITSCGCKRSIEAM